MLGFLYFKIKNLKNSIDFFSLFFIFFKVGSILYGSGYILISYLQDELVHQRSWITSQQLVDAIAIGQLTPGPILSAATFIGYTLKGLPGGILATIGIFLPSFFLILFLTPILPKLRNNIHFSLFLNCINASSLGVMLYAVWTLAKVSLHSYEGVALSTIVALIYFFFKPISSHTLRFVGFGFFIGIMTLVAKNHW